MGGLEEGFFEP